MSLFTSNVGTSDTAVAVERAQLRVTVPRDAKERLEVHCQKWGLTQSSVVERLLTAFLASGQAFPPVIE